MRWWMWLLFSEVGSGCVERAPAVSVSSGAPVAIAAAGTANPGVEAGDLAGAGFADFGGGAGGAGVEEGLEVAGVGGSGPAAGGPAQQLDAEPREKTQDELLLETCGQLTAARAPGECFKAFPNRVTCPLSFDEGLDQGLCGLRGRTAPATCKYPEAVCKCRHEEYCGGAMPTLFQQEGMRWSCVLPPRPGECPEVPVHGARCVTAGQECFPRKCGWDTRCTCRNGKFHCVSERWKSRPPSARPIEPGPL